MAHLDDVIASLTGMPGGARQEAVAAGYRGTARFIWKPNPGMQTEAYFCEADELLVGGEVAGGKSDIGIGLAINEHTSALILRRVGQDAGDLGERFCQAVGTRRGYSSNPPTFTAADKLVEFRGMENEKDKQRRKGKARDLIVWDQIEDFLESQYVFVNQWNRTAKKGQRCRVVATSNGPTTAEGQWIVRRWGAWLDPSHSNPAQSGEIRWYLMTGAGEIEVDGPGPHDLDGPGKKPRKANSRCFIRAFMAENLDIAQTNYGTRLEGATEDLQRAYARGDFTVGMEDGAFQLIPTAWIEAAMERWTIQRPKGSRMSAIGADIAQGGSALTVLSPRYGAWYDELRCLPGKETREGHQVAAAIVQVRRDKCPVVIDLGGGWGGDALAVCRENGIPAVGFLGVQPSTARSRDGKYKFVNKRAEGYWRMREELDPNQDGGSIVQLPPDPILKADLAAARFSIERNGILIEPKADIMKRIGRSPDRGDAVVMCGSEGDKAIRMLARQALQGGAPQVKANVGNAGRKARMGGR